MADIVEAGSRGLGAQIGSKVAGVLFRSFNPAYSKEHARKMRYIQRKYVQAYGQEPGEDINQVIASQNDRSRIKMSPRGYHPANPFRDERAFEEALQPSLAPRRGRQGRFAASHAYAAIGRIVEYQIQRKSRTYVPGVSGHGRPNDYVNLFLEEIKEWCLDQLALDTVVEEELARRETYFRLLKHDDYYWCFPKDAKHHDHKLHAVIDFVHDKVRDALEVVRLEARNKSLHALFKELNDHATNALHHGQRYLAYLLYARQKAGADLADGGRQLRGATYAEGRLLRLLERATAAAARAHVLEEGGQARFTSPAIENASQPSAALTAGEQKDGGGGGGGAAELALVAPGGALAVANGGGNGAAAAGARGGGGGGGAGAGAAYDVVVTRLPSLVGKTTYRVAVLDPEGRDWAVLRKHAEFEQLHKDLQEVCTQHKIVAPEKKKKKGLSISDAEHERRAEQLQVFISELLNVLHKFPSDLKRLRLSEFLGVHHLVNPTMRVVPAEEQPNTFAALQEDLKAALNEGIGTNGKTDPSEKNKELVEMHKEWGGGTAFMKILEAHALLQRAATVLGWTLEIAHFFVAMFGNTLAFSRLPLRDVLATQRDILQRFQTLSADLYETACAVNRDRDYKWHKNLRAVEAAQKSCHHHIEAAVRIITTVETEHLDHDAQMRRLQDVARRFGPLLARLDARLPAIRGELQLPALPAVPAAAAAGGGAAAAEGGAAAALLLGGLLGGEPGPAAAGGGGGGAPPAVEEPGEEEEKGAAGGQGQWGHGGVVIEEVEDEIEAARPLRTGDIRFVDGHRGEGGAASPPGSSSAAQAKQPNNSNDGARRRGTGQEGGSKKEEDGNDCKRNVSNDGEESSSAVVVARGDVKKQEGNGEGGDAAKKEACVPVSGVCSIS